MHCKALAAFNLRFEQAHCKMSHPLSTHIAYTVHPPLLLTLYAQPPDIHEESAQTFAAATQCIHTISLQRLVHWRLSTRSGHRPVRQARRSDEQRRWVKAPMCELALRRAKHMQCPTRRSATQRMLSPPQHKCKLARCTQCATASIDYYTSW